MIMRWTRFPLCRPFRAAANDLGTIAQRVTFAKNRNRRLRGSNTRRFEKNCRDYYQNRGSRSIFTRIEGYNAFITRFFNQQSLYLFFAQSLEHVSQTSRYICSDSRKQFLRKIDLSSRAGISVVIFRDSSNYNFYANRAETMDRANDREAVLSLLLRKKLIFYAKSWTLC